LFVSGRVRASEAPYCPWVVK